MPEDNHSKPKYLKNEIKLSETTDKLPNLDFDLEEKTKENLYKKISEYHKEQVSKIYGVPKHLMGKNKIKKYVVGFAFYEDDILLIRKERPSWQKGYLNGIGGKIEDDDITINHSMSREFEEETGVKTDPYQWKKLVEISNSEFILHVFTSFNTDFTEAKSMTDENIIRMNLNDFFTKVYSNEIKIIDNLLWIIPMALDVHINKNGFNKIGYVS